MTSEYFTVNYFVISDVFVEIEGGEWGESSQFCPVLTSISVDLKQSLKCLLLLVL